MGSIKTIPHFVTGEDSGKNGVTYLDSGIIINGTHDTIMYLYWMQLKIIWEAQEREHFMKLYSIGSVINFESLEAMFGCNEDGECVIYQKKKNLRRQCKN